MICTECGREVKRVCADCRAKRARAGMLLHQRRFLQTWLAGGIDLRVRRKGDTLHAELYDDRWHAFCGIDMYENPALVFMRQMPADICPDCRAVFDQLVDQARQEVPCK